MFATLARLMAKKPKPKMKPIEPRMPPERIQTISRTIFDIVKEHGPLTIAETWEHLKDQHLMNKMGEKSFKEVHLQIETAFSASIRTSFPCFADVGLRGLTSKRHMKILLRWMRERQKLRLICNHDGPHKQFLYTTWFTNPRTMPPRPRKGTSEP